MRIIINIFLLSVFILSCSTDDNSKVSNRKKLNQFTPNQADWSTFYSKPILQGFYSHDPDGFRFTPKDFEIAKWDGRIYNPTQMTRSEFHRAICPNDDMIVGLRELFYEEKPFEDNKNPTKAEVDEWHKMTINHVRELVGYDKEEDKIEKDSCYFIRTLWSDQMKNTTMWDEKYPDKVCANKSKAHCGFRFIPDESDQRPYLQIDKEPCKITAESEGALVGSRSHIAWSLKLSRTFCQILRDEGFWGGHMSPFFRSKRFGMSYRDNNLSFEKSYTNLRVLWSAKLNAEKYPKP